MPTPITGPLTRSPSGGVTGVGGGAALSAFSAAKFAIQQNSADVNILVIGDSTGVNTNQWVYLFGQWLEAEYPTHAVSYRAWNDVGGVYDAAVSLGTGSGPRTIRIWNASVSGSPAFYMTGSKHAAAVAAISPDVVIFNHGKNDTFLGNYIIRGELLMGVEAVRQQHPNVPVAALLQMPNRDDLDMDAPIAQWVDIAADYGDLTLVDSHAPFVSAGKAASLYVDNKHPSADGTALILAAVQQRWRSAVSGSGLDPVGAFLDTAGTNLLTNGDFSAFSAAVPDSWTALNSPTCAKELTIVDGASPYSVKVTGTSASARINQGRVGANLTPMLGQKVTLAVRLRVPDGSASTVGAVQLSYIAGATTAYTSRSVTFAQGGWRWCIISGVDIPANATRVDVALYCDTAANAGSTVYYDRAILVVGDIPRDMA